MFVVLLLCCLINAAQSETASSLSEQQIFDDHDRLRTGQQKQFPNSNLAFVTPWNPIGYDWAKAYGKKFSHVSPVWLELLVANDQCSIHGSHDVDQEWLADVREANPDVLIVPRLLVQYEDVHSALTFATSEKLQSACFKTLLEFLTRNNFDGVVFEHYSQMFSILEQIKQNKGSLLQLIINLAEHMKAKEKLMLLVVPPCRDNRDQKSPFEPEDLDRIAPYVDFVIVMTYDYPLTGELNENGPPVLSPLPWIRQCMERLRRNSTSLAAKLLMGVNFYGYAFSGRALFFNESHQPEIVVGSSYLEYLKEKPQIFWREDAYEHVTFFPVADKLCNYPSRFTINFKIDLAKELGVGLAIWDLGQGLLHFLENM